jgi:hypothetical protein
LYGNNGKNKFFVFVYRIQNTAQTSIPENVFLEYDPYGLPYEAPYGEPRHIPPNNYLPIIPTTISSRQHGEGA